jgi:hypothetical protein
MKEKICPGIVNVVKLLRAKGFKTTDSGDGSHFKEGMEGAFEEPMVACKPRHPDCRDSWWTANKLLKVLREYGYDAHVELTYSPNDGVTTLTACGEGLRGK